jgi:hypothetical protein
MKVPTFRSLFVLLWCIPYTCMLHDSCTFGIFLFYNDLFLLPPGNKISSIVYRTPLVRPASDIETDSVCFYTINMAAHSTLKQNT